MKNKLFITALLSLVLYTTASTQELDLLAFNQGAEPKRYAPVPMDDFEEPNAHYVSKITSSSFLTSVHPMQQKVAKFELDALQEFDKNEPSRYHVVFANENALVHAWYDSKGELVKTIERYKNQVLPSHVRKKIALEYPKWSFGDNVLVVRFVRGKKLRHNLRLHMTLGKNRKTAKFSY
ncbi:hypothetical protein [Flagellimonas algicola]|uniref:PepSY-like beta-lactamase-inhibitor n=1 Tax=Flagellimonas algicola TaxID=2583815 RepID=A0ABY2WK97_9FLAO|nr:hypothetical protein [Allomuricauda algicola]TMU54976.1 hypothetical protein FGG15_12340 [Allomuricauda algicola]